MKQISKTRFDAHSGYARMPLASLISEELLWFESKSGTIFATLITDLEGEYSGYIFAPDAIQRYRCVEQTGFFGGVEQALDEVRSKMQQVEEGFDNLRIQGDEPKRKVDFFVKLPSSKILNENFVLLQESIGLIAARRIIEILMRWYEDQDGNFVEQFQTTGFDARIWELYLYAAFIEAGYAVSHPKPAPDYLLMGNKYSFTVEATTINPSIHEGHPKIEEIPEEEGGILDYVSNYLPIRYAGPLIAKLKKGYWKYSHVAGKPFAIAIQDFHSKMSMTYSGDALTSYLYGLKLMMPTDVTNPAFSTDNTVKIHRWKSKQVESSFFTQPGSEHISAVIFNACGTLTKFNRMGVGADFGDKNVALRHVGRRFDNSTVSKSKLFSEVVEKNYAEKWIDGMIVYHNPNALCALPEDALPGAMQVFLSKDGALRMISPDGHLLNSKTATVISRDPS